MSSDQNRATALRMIEALSAGELDESILTEDVAWWVPGQGIVSKAAFLTMAQGFRALLNGPLTMTVHGVTAEGDRVAVEAESHAAMSNGKIYNNTYHFLFLFRDGKICLAKEYNDSAHVAAVFGSGAFAAPTPA
jgi:ketosteroid isomerase-like protein